MGPSDPHFPLSDGSVHGAQFLSHVQLLVTPRTLAHQAPLFMGFSRQKYWIGLPFPTLAGLPHPGIQPASLASPTLAGEFFTIVPSGKPHPLM